MVDNQMSLDNFKKSKKDNSVTREARFNTISSHQAKSSPFRQKYYEEYYRLAAESRQKSQPSRDHIHASMEIQGRNQA